MVCFEGLGLMALDPCYECGYGGRPGRWGSARRLWEDVVLIGAATGVGVGVLEALVLTRHGIAVAYWWAVANPPAWALGWLVMSYVITTNVDQRFTNFGAGGALVFGVLTWLLLAVLFRTAGPEVRATAAR